MTDQPERTRDTLRIEVPLSPLPPEETLHGEPRAGAVELHRLGGTRVGVWVMTEGECRDVETDEVFVVLEGSAHLVVEDREEVDLLPGTVVRLHAGERTRWVVRSTLRKLYVSV